MERITGFSEYGLLEGICRYVIQLGFPEWEDSSNIFPVLYHRRNGVGKVVADVFSDQFWSDRPNGLSPSRFAYGFLDEQRNEHSYSPRVNSALLLGAKRFAKGHVMNGSLIATFGHVESFQEISEAQAASILAYVNTYKMTG